MARDLPKEPKEGPEISYEEYKDCPHCASGTVWRTPSGRHFALYPGGPFCG